MMNFILGICFLLVNSMCFSQIQIGDNLDDLKIIKKYSILITPSQIEDGYEVMKDNITYDVCANNNKKIYFISTNHAKFRFQGLQVGSVFKEIKNVKKHYNLRGWGYVVETGNDWNCVFTTSSIKLTSKITFFFKFDSNLKDSSNVENKLKFNFFKHDLKLNDSIK